MDSLKIIRTLLIDYMGNDLDNTLLGYSEIHEKDLLQRNSLQKVYNAIFNLFADPTQSPENMIHLLDINTSGLDEFSKNPFLQTVVAFACFEALAKRKPEVLDGPWETLMWVLIKYSSYASINYETRLKDFKKPNLATIKFIIEIGSHELCPNPYLRLEIFRLMRCFNCSDLLKKVNGCESYCDNCKGWFEINYYCESYCVMVINTLIELSENHPLLTVDQVPHFSPIDLEFIMKDNSINMTYIMRNCKLEKKKSKIIVAILKLIRNFTVIEKGKHNERHTRFFNYGISLDEQVSACLSLCGLLLPSQNENFDRDVCANQLVQAVENDYFLLNYVIDTLNAVYELILCGPDNRRKFRPSAYSMKDNLLHRLFKGHNKQFYKFQNILEINGGFAPAVEYRLRCFQCNSRDRYNPHDSDYDSESGLY